MAYACKCPKIDTLIPTWVKGRTVAWLTYRAVHVNNLLAPGSHTGLLPPCPTQVRSTPCFMIFKDQQLLHTQLGPNKEKLEDALRHFVLEGKMPKGRLYFPQT